MNSANNKKFLTATFYQFVGVEDCEQLRTSLVRLCQANHVSGTVIIAAEGINATICGEPAAVQSVLAFLRADPRFGALEHKESFSDAPTLVRLKVKVKPEIITMRQPSVDAARNAGQYIEPEQWNALISKPEVVVIDTRNDYEVKLGTFRDSVNPETAHFSDLSDWIDKQENLKEKPPVAMFCTGGIRCEKSTALLRAKGFENVYHLHGGILRYLEKVAEQDSLFEGECFVFDSRVSVNHQLERGSYDLCYGCGNPISEQDKASTDYIPAKQCPQCVK